jgi:hypothetical protein
VVGESGRGGVPWWRRERRRVERMVEDRVGFVEAASVNVVINRETKEKTMDKVNCELYRFTIELNLRAQFAHQCKRMDDDHSHSMARQ